MDYSTGSNPRDVIYPCNLFGEGKINRVIEKRTQKE